MQDTTHERQLEENETDFEYSEAEVEISKEQVFVEVLRMVRERARLRDRKYPADSRLKRIVPNRSCTHTAGDEETDQRNARYFANDRMIDAALAPTSSASRSQRPGSPNAQKPRPVPCEGRSWQC
jgi:hypothetical protein